MKTLISSLTVKIPMLRIFFYTIESDLHMLKT